ncbi:hypothetical protein CYQ23_13630, partial [Enterococcus faecalis]
MIQMKFKQLATVGVCCSMLANSLGGVTAVAETMTIESSPTVESTKESTRETESPTTKTEEGTAKVEANKEEAVLEKQETMETVEEGNAKITEIFNDEESLLQPKQISPKATMNFPQLTYQFGFIDETGMRVDASTIHLAYDIWVGEALTTTNVWKTLSIEKGRLATTNNNLKEIIYPKQSLNTVSGRYWQYSAANLTFIPPRYYEKMSVYNKNGNFDTNYLFPNINIYNALGSNVAMETPTKNLSSWFELKKSGSQSFIFNQTIEAAPVDVQVPAYLRELIYPDQISNVGGYYVIDKPVYYYLTNRKVTENFVDATGAKITPPTGFTQGKQTVIDSDSFTYTSSKALPDTYTASSGKTYKFKGWYKGTTKPATLKTEKTPSYAVTYDNQDDMTAVYAEVAMETLPGYTYQFGFVDEAGQLIDPTKVGLTYDLWAYEDKVETVTEKGVNANNNGQLKEMKIADRVVKQPTAATAGEDTIYSPINMQVTLPKYYQTLTPSDGTNAKYPVPQMIQSSSGREENLPVTEATFALKELKPYTFGMKNLFTNPLTPNTPYPTPFRRYTKWAGGPVPVNTMYSKVLSPVYYMVKNRRVTENYVDVNGAKITPPERFTQGKQTVINSDSFTYTSAEDLPEMYNADGKTYKFKGWYKGTTKPATLKTEKTPSYAVTYDDQDDLTVVYEEVQAIDFPELTYQFGFVDESGKRVDASTVGLIYDRWFGENRLGTVMDWSTRSLEENLTAPTNNNLKEIIYPAHSVALKEGTDLQFSAVNIRFVPPKYYGKMSIYPPNDVNSTVYPFPKLTLHPSGTPGNMNAIGTFELKSNEHQEFEFSNLTAAAPIGIRLPWYLRQLIPSRVNDQRGYYSASGPFYYYLTKRRITENFIDTNGTKITPPAGFTQGNQIVIDNDNFTYTSAQSLPEIYQADGKSYRFKGWYKGNEKENLKTTKTPSYAVTYDDQDDMTAVYEEGKWETLPGYTYQFGFVDEAGQLIDPTKVDFTYDMWAYEDKVETITEKAVNASNNGQLKEMKIADRVVKQPTAATAGEDTIYSPINMQVTLPKYYQTLIPSDGTNTNYPVPQMVQYPAGREQILSVTEETFALKELKPYTFGMKNLFTNELTPNTPYPRPFRRYTNWNSAGGLVPVNTLYSKVLSPVYYMLQNRRVTENFVDANGAKITPPEGFTQGQQTSITSNDFTYTSAKALPDTYTAGGKTYKFKGW